MGRLVREPEVRYTSTNNTLICNFTIAVDDGYGDKKTTDFINCTAWSKTGENIAKFFNKGDMITVAGKIKTRCWDDNEGKKHYATDIRVDEFYFCGGKKEEAEQPEQFTTVESTDELPF